MLHRVEDKRRLEKLIQDHLKKSPELRPFPEAVTRLVSACRKEETTSKDIESIIACDPSLSVKILRLANSPLFCPSRDVNNIVHAVALLGRRKVKSIAMSAAAADIISSGQGAALQRQELWTHSVGCAAVASSLAGRTNRIDQDDAFLAGIFHDVGKLLFLDTIADEYDELTSSYLGASLVDEESFLFGTTHEDIGVTAANLWGLPDELLCAIGWHHRPDQNPFGHPQAKLISLANDLARGWGIGSRAVPDNAIDATLLDQLGIAVEDLAEIQDDALATYEQSCDLSPV
ncbi:MAG: HDOD domain-containing protein [Pirellulaceae bacterium]